ncbi:NAD-P-binding protein [Trametes coccinea BRFM310]|uniref:NAD-P-binding protein n=1 Tax=Trametes coccinea (strain BRFM310) TaxID=1353009 RepID=A0A1Y2IAP4_TRAC3|nr:NAD-P-binding protein [Trametes coccinea BRFM310]
MAPRIWLITGASSGFGRHLTELVLSRGETVVAAVRRPAALSDLSSKHTSESLLVLKMDVTQPRNVIDGFDQVRKAFGRLDVVVNNAGWAMFGEVEGFQESIVRDLLETNFWGAALVTREAVKFFREVNPTGVGGRLIQNSSQVGVAALPTSGFYAASKAALEAISEALAAELDPAWNIKVTLIEGGGFQTEGVGKIVWQPDNPAYSHLKSQLARGFVPSGDPKKAVKVFYEVASLPAPPLHLPLGKDSIALIRSKWASVSAEVDRHEYLSGDLEVDDRVHD